jgi:hypothetical protein
MSAPPSEPEVEVVLASVTVPVVAIGPLMLTWSGSKRGQAPLCKTPSGPFRQRSLTPF